MPRILFFIWMSLAANATVHAQFVMEEADHTHNYTFPTSDVYNTMKWVKKDLLSGRQIDLYYQLDSGLVIVQEYVMMDCQPCITAGKGLSNVISSMKKLHPGRIRYFITVYDDKTGEKKLKQWVKDNGFEPDGVFLQGNKEIAYYGGMGMPTILVLGGGMRHKGYYKRLGYSPRENGVIIKAMRRALTLSENKFEKENNE